MSRHYDADLIARWREGLVSGRKADRVRRHLTGCAACAATESALVSVTAMLAQTRAPAMPDHLAERLQLAIASESSARAAGMPAAVGEPSGAISAGSEAPGVIPGRPDLPERSGRRARRLRMPDLSSPLLLRGLAATGAVVIIAGAGFLLASGQQPSGTSPTAGGKAPLVSPGPRRPESTVGTQKFSNVKRTSVEYRRKGELATAAVTQSGVNFTRANLASQVRTQVASAPEPIAASPSPGPSGSSAGKSTDLHGVSLSQLAGCLTAVAMGREVLLADVASYLGNPATVIVLQAPAQADVFDVVIVGLACSSSDSDIIARDKVTKAPAG